MIILRWLLAILIGSSGASFLWAQEEGDVWVMGYATFTPDLPDFGLAYWDFSDINPVIEYDIHARYRIFETNASISREGEIMLMTNGMQIIDPSGESIIDTIAYLDDGDNWMFHFLKLTGIPGGFPKLQSAIILPIPGTTDEYSVIYYHAKSDPITLFFTIVAVLEAKLRKEGNQGWEVLYKDRIILEREYLSQNTWHSCRHANGRDWWILMHDWDGDTYYRLLLDPTGINVAGEQKFDEEINIHSNVWFSPNGEKYAKYIGITNEQSIVYLYDFDRCTGVLSNRMEMPISGTSQTFEGLCFSPDSRYLFITTNGHELYQYDLMSAEIESSRILVDTNDGYIEPNWFNTTFGPMMPGPDGRVYMFPTSGSSRAVHVIDRPNERGKDAKLLQHHIMLQTSKGRSVQNFANFRLGPLDGSPCDTLGIDNHPQSRWRYEIEDADPQEIRFTDLSFFRPEVWRWDFGDEEISSTSSPIHTYASPGLYYACLTVSNEYSSDTSCQWIEIESVSVDDPEQEEMYIVHPNPFKDEIELTPLPNRQAGPDHQTRYRTLDVTIIDIHGRVISSMEMTCPCRLKLGEIPAGVYFYRLEEEGRVVQSGKVVKSGNR